ncbi:MAG: hypothetical protein JXA60_09685 [Candidatus Coatesbacteria bacterium]|nr:hypothetical protein [Candidatus Coatesbacteria bacterium]
MYEVKLSVVKDDLRILNDFLSKNRKIFKEFTEVEEREKGLIWQPSGIIQQAYVSKLFGFFAGSTYNCQERIYGFVMSPEFARRWNELPSIFRIKTICHEFYHQYYQIRIMGSFKYFISYYFWFLIRPKVWLRSNYYYKYSHIYESVKCNGAFITDEALENYLT